MGSKTAVVTGSNRGLGLELVRQLSQDEKYSKIYALCRSSNDDMRALAEASSKIIIVENVDVSQDEVTSVLQTTFPASESIELLIHNAGAFGPPHSFDDPMQVYNSQNLDTVTMDDMRFCLELNTLGPLRVTQALLSNLKASTTADDPTKIIIITSLMGSLQDNTSGRIYGYRTSKAAVNMVGKSLAEDLKKENIAVGLIHPGMVYTGFGGGLPRRKGQRDIEPSTKGVLEAVEATDLSNTGVFLHGNYGEGVKPLPW